MTFQYEHCDTQVVFFLISEEDYDQFCLAYMFTYRDFEMGTLGLAWTGDLKNAGGVCEKNGVSGVCVTAGLCTGTPICVSGLK
jgi:hypothetical protein